MDENFQNRIENKESFTPRPHLLDVVKIGDRLAQVAPSSNHIIFLNEKAETGLNKAYLINWDDYICEETNKHVVDLRKSGDMSDDEFWAVHWDSEDYE